MGFTHHACLFEYEFYQTLIHPLVKQVDQQHYEIIREYTSKAIQKLQKEWPLSNLGYIKHENGVSKEVMVQEWPLFEHGGGSLETEDEINAVLNPAPRDVGYWFLIILAQYLQFCPSSLGNWSVLKTVLALLKWRSEDCELLFEGLPSHQLLKPNLLQKSPKPLKNKDPYWFWVHPDRGWLPIEEVQRLYNKLKDIEKDVLAFDIHQFPGILVDNPVVVRDYQKYLRDGYADTLSMLATANEAKQGLFMSVRLG
ncbi:MAG: hypothetical protein GY805_15680 [Chloroflexi bacterium]|nr:hypothetical protein [Chloroflexota bacterium]